MKVLFGAVLVVVALFAMLLAYGLGVLFVVPMAGILPDEGGAEAALLYGVAS